MESSDRGQLLLLIFASSKLYKKVLAFELSPGERPYKGWSFDKSPSVTPNFCYIVLKYPRKIS